MGLPKEARELLANLTVASTDIQPPGMFHYLPHLIGKPDGLRPSHKLSQSRRGGRRIQLVSSLSSLMDREPNSFLPPQPNMSMNWDVAGFFLPGKVGV